MKCISCISSAIILIILIGCPTPNYDIEKKTAENSIRKNLIVSLPINDVWQGCLEALSNDYQLKNKIGLKFWGTSLWSFEVKTENPIFCKDIFKLDNTEYDICFNKFSEYWYSKSYLVNSEPPLARGRFHIHLEKLTNTSTEVIVKIVEYKVVNGLECCGPHGRYVRLTSVDPTGADEYEIIRYLAGYFKIDLNP